MMVPVEIDEQLIERLGAIAGITEQLASVAGRHGLSRICVSVGDAKIEIETSRKRAVGETISQRASVENEPVAPPSFAADGAFIRAPMIGTFYLSPAPGEPAYVDVGDIVETGQVIAIIEAMKIMNEIVSEQTGVIAEMLVSNGQAVEYSQPLFRIIPLEDSST